WGGGGRGGGPAGGGVGGSGRRCPQNPAARVGCGGGGGRPKMGNPPKIPPPIWKNPRRAVRSVLEYQSIRRIMYSTPPFTMRGSQSPRVQAAANMLPRVESSQPGTKSGRARSGAATIQEAPGSGRSSEAH